jgi:putative ABC transport system permease protein
MLVRLALQQVAHRPGLTFLSALLVAIAVVILMSTWMLTQQVHRVLTRDAQGVDLVVGAKGSPLQLMLAALYHVDVPPGNIAFGELEALRQRRFVAQVIPLSLGDTVAGFRIVGTTQAYAELYQAELSAGQWMQAPMQAVVGELAARTLGLKPGATFIGQHGLGRDGPAHDDHVYTVTGVLKRTGTVLDRLVLTPLESVWQVHEGEPADEEERRQLEESREVTAVLVRYSSPLAAASLPRAINAEPGLQAASPAVQSARLVQLMEPLMTVLQGIGAAVAVGAALSIWVVLWQALEQRRRESAVLKTLGARAGWLARLFVAEGMLTAGLGVLLGLVFSAALVVIFAFRIDASVRLADLVLVAAPAGLALVVGALLLGALAAALPAWRAARVQVADVLNET